MSHKKRGQLTTSGEWAQHLRPLGRRVFWKRERQAARDHVIDEIERAEEATQDDPIASWVEPTHRPAP